MASSTLKKLLVDVHSHVYLPRYVSLLRSRTNVPRIKRLTTPDGKPDDRLLILTDEPSTGRPVGPQYWDRDEKLKFMEEHGIDVTVVSTANPWLDFLPPAEAHKLALELNEELEQYCSSSPGIFNAQIPRLHWKGAGRRALDPVWAAIEAAGLVVFVHPHYGVDAKAWGEKDNGHVLPLALGFPFETTTAITRLILSGVLDRFPSLKLLLAHSGGALPILSSRLSSCIVHDPVVASRLKHDARYYIGKLYLDAVSYGPEEMGYASEAIARASRYQTGSQEVASQTSLEVKRSIGSKRMLFGTDHPFFPPLSSTERWKSVVENLQAIEDVQGWSEDDKDGVRGGNAVELFGLKS